MLCNWNWIDDFKIPYDLSRGDPNVECSYAAMAHLSGIFNHLGNVSKYVICINGNPKMSLVHTKNFRFLMFGTCLKHIVGNNDAVRNFIKGAKNSNRILQKVVHLDSN